MALNSQNVGQPDKTLTDMLEADLVPQDSAMICEKVLTSKKFPNTAQTNGKYGKKGKRDAATQTLVANGDPYAQVKKRTFSQVLYDMDVHGLADVITDIDRANISDPFTLESDLALDLGHDLILAKEKDLHSKLTTIGNYTTGDGGNAVALTGNAQFTNKTDSDPISVINAGIARIFLQTGVYPKMILPANVRTALRIHPNLIDKLGFKNNRPGQLSDADLLTAFFDVTEIISANAIDETGESNSFIWGNDIILLVAPPVAKRNIVTTGFQFQWGNARQVFKMPDPLLPNTTRILVRDVYESNISNYNAAYLIKDAV
jgi:hypothetical protein